LKPPASESTLPNAEPSLRELCDPLRGLWLFAGVVSMWSWMALPPPWGICAGLSVGLAAVLCARSSGSKVAVGCGLILQLASGLCWETVPEARDLAGRFEVVVLRETSPGKGVCRILSGGGRDLEGRQVRCTDGALGDTLRGYGELLALRSATNPGGFDARSWGASAGIEGFLRWNKDDPPRRLAGRALWGERIRDWTETVTQKTLRRRLEPSSAGLWTATILAKNDALPTDALNAFRQSGLFHMLSVSGFHMAVLGGGLVVFLTLVRVPRRWAWVFASLLVLAYSWLLRFPPPVTRSAVAFAALAGAMSWGRMPHARNALFLAAAILIALDPNTPFQMGAQLTFVATAALLWGTPVLLAWIPLRWRRGRMEEWFLAPLCASLAATLSTAPLLAWHVGVVAWIGIPAGLVSAFAFAVGFLAALGTVALGGLPAWCSWGFAGAAEGCARLVYEVALRAGEWIPGRWIPGRPSPWVLAGCLAVMVLLGFTRRPKFAGTMWVALFATASATLLLALWPDRTRMRLVFLDVGQGDATLVTWPSGRHWLVDAGPGARNEQGRDAGRDVILPAMRILGMKTLDAVVVSHPDFDHYGGLNSVALESPPSNLFVSMDTGMPPSKGFDSLRAHLDRMGWRFHAAGGGQNLTYGDGARCEVVAPGVWRSVPRNQASLVLRFAYDTARALIPGDADSISEAYQVASGEGLRSQILHVGHHGSRHSSSLAWLRLVSPREAVLSYGKTNRYGHPNAEVLARLDSVGARAWRTPDGAVVASLSGSGAVVEPAPRAWWRGPWRRTDLSFRPPWI